MKRRMKIFVFFGTLLVPAVLCLAQTTAVWYSANKRHLEPDLQPVLSVHDEDVKATISPAPYSFILKLQFLHNPGTTREVKVSENVAQVDELSLWRDRIIIRGIFNNADAVLVILDKNTGDQIDEFNGYWPAISLKSGLLIFTKIYPTHFADGTEDHYMVYRLDKPLTDNRPPGNVPLRGRPVGIPLYPINVGNENFDNVQLSGPQHIQQAMGFFWNEQGNEAITLDNFGEESTLVLIRFGSDEAQIETLEVEKSDLCPDRESSHCRPDFDLEHAVFVTAKDGSESVEATFGYPQSPPGTVVTIPVSKFVLTGTRSLIHPQWAKK